MDRPEATTSTELIPTDPREAILSQQLAAAVARGGGVQWWGRGSFEAVVSYHRYLPGQRWTYALRLLVLGLFVPRFGSAGTPLDKPGLVLWLGVTVLWAGRTRYERITVDEHGGVKEAGAGLLAAAAGATLLAGLLGTISGGAHLEGVIQTAVARGYAYDFRLTALILLGTTMVLASVLCLTAVRGLARGQRRAWDRAMIGTLFLLLATAPITPLPAQGQQAAFLAFPAALNLIVLVVAWGQLEVD
jgi:hypothetical protein